MSVIASQRKPGKLDTLTAARELARYTFTITKNETQFPRRDRWMLTQEIVRETAAILGHIKRGNAIRVTYATDYAARRTEQVQALACISALLGYIDLAYTTLQLDSDRVKYWTGLCVELERMAKGWADGDAERYGHLLEKA